MLNIADSITIMGGESNGTTISGNGTERVFTIGDTLPRTVILENLNISQGNTAESGGGILVFGQTDFTLRNSTISDNTAAINGGGIDIVDSAKVSIENSTISNNTTTLGNGGGVNIANSPLVPPLVVSVRNSTISGNTAGGTGGGFSLGSNSRLRLENSTVTQNNSDVMEIGGIAGPDNQIDLINSIVANNNNGDLLGPVNLMGNNLTGNLPELLLAPLGDNGGLTQTHALLPGSSAIDAGTGTGTDQRGVGANGIRDIGAFESRGFNIVATEGTPQTANVGQAFAPLIIRVDSDFSEPVVGGTVNFTVNPGTTGAAADLNETTVFLDNNGQANVTATANTFLGDYEVTANTQGATTPATFSLSNALLGNIIVDTLIDENDNNVAAGDVSLREALTFAESGSVISFNQALRGNTITLNSGELVVNRDLFINGLGRNDLSISGNNASRVFNVTGGTTNATISDLRITGGNADFGGGIRVENGSRLNLINSQLDNNSGAIAGVYSEGNIQVSNSSLDSIETATTGTTQLNGSILTL